MHENVTMSYRPKQLWSVGLESFLCQIKYELPADGLCSEGELTALPVADILKAFDEWWCTYCDFPVDLRQASLDP